MLCLFKLRLSRFIKKLSEKKNNEILGPLNVRYSYLKNNCIEKTIQLWQYAYCYKYQLMYIVSSN